MGGVTASEVRIGVVGGTFDPPHLAHLVLGAAARAALRLDRVLFVPAGEPWRKTGQAVSPAAERLALTRLAVEPFTWAEVSAIEVEREGPSYSADTMSGLAAGGGRWWFVLGADALADLPHWHEPERLIAAARLAVATRPQQAEAIPLATVERFPGIEDRIDRVPMPALTVSSTELRTRIAAGRATEGLIPQAVRARINASGLYQRGERTAGDGTASG